MISARRSGSLEAQRARLRLGLLDQRRIEIFDVIQDAGVWLMFQPLDRLYGLYRRVDDVSGIAISTKYPPSVQRYTAAHELGHHLLGHGYSIDDVHNVEGARGLPETLDFDRSLVARSAVDVGDPLEEAAAQAFAATFLMPVQVINRVLRDAGHDRDRPRLDPEDVYQFSLELGVSYEAAVTQLAVLGKVSWDRAKELRLPPISIKTSIAGRRPENSRADVWLVEGTDGERQLRLRVEDEVIIRLTESPTSGYAWELADDIPGHLEIVRESLTAVDDDVEVHGGAAQRALHLRAIASGEGPISLELARPWVPNEPLRAITIGVHVAEPPTGQQTHGLVEAQQRLRAIA